MGTAPSATTPAAPATLWQLASEAGEGFAVVGDGEPVAKGDILRHAAELADALAGEELGDRRGLGAVVTGSPVATAVAVLAHSSAGRPAAIVGPPNAPWAARALRDLSPAVVVHDTGGGGSLVPTTRPVIRLDGRTGALADRTGGGDRPGRATSLLPDDEDPARRPFLAFRTSGTSGAARWVVHSEATLWASLDSKLRGMARYGRDAGLSDEARSIVDAVVGAPRAVFIPLATISGYTQLVHCVALDVPIVTMADLLPRTALRLTSSAGAGTLVVTPSVLRLMMALPEVRTSDWGRLGVVGVGGGHLRPELLAAAEEAFGAVVVQGYGSTELGGAVTNVRVYDGPEVRGHTVGRPLGGVTVEVRRPDGTEAAPGEAGEIMVRAPDRVALGRLSARAGGAFEPLDLRGGFHPTGDVGTVRPDRNLVVLGRTGGRISRGDEAFYPEEVEAVLESHPRVLRALVTSEERDGRVVVLATCQVRGPRTVPAAELRAWCRQRLSRARCPDVVAFGTVRQAGTGKTLRHQLSP